MFVCVCLFEFMPVCVCDSNTENEYLLKRYGKHFVKMMKRALIALLPFMCFHYLFRSMDVFFCSKEFSHSSHLYVCVPYWAFLCTVQTQYQLFTKRKLHSMRKRPITKEYFSISLADLRHKIRMNDSWHLNAVSGQYLYKSHIPVALTYKHSIKWLCLRKWLK